MVAPQHFTLHEVQNVTVVRFSSTKLLQIADWTLVQQQLTGLVNNGRHRLLLSFSGMEFMLAAGFKVVHTLHSRITELGGTLVICGVNLGIMEIFKIHESDEWLTIAKDEQEALQRFHPPAPSDPSGQVT